MKNAQHLTALISIAILSLVVTSVAATQGVSPGALDRLSVVNDTCPTFSWQESDEAGLYEIVAYSLHENDDPISAEFTTEAEVLYARVPGGATSWTPSSEQCFAPGGRYVWFIRAVTEAAGDQVIEASEWSQARYFLIPAAPSVEDVAQALEVLQRYVAQGGEGALLTGAALGISDTGTETGTGHRTSMGGTKSVPTASAAIRGEHSDTSGEKYGVVGISMSYDGAGVAASNLEGGADLVLDGSVNGAADALIYESSLDRPSPDDQIFVFHNSGPGAMDLHVFGGLHGDTIDVDEVWVSSAMVIDDTGNWLGAGDTIPCVGCVASADILDGSIIDNDLADDAVTESKIEHGAVSSSRLANSAVTSVKIADGTIIDIDLADDAVTSAKIANGAVDTDQLRGGAVTGVKIADGSVVSADIADGTITGADLADNSVTGAKIAAGAVGSTDIHSNSINGAHIVDGSVANPDLADNSVTGAKIAAGAIGSTDIHSNSINGTHIVDGSVANADLADSSVTSAKIADGSITGADIGSGEVSTSHYMNMSISTAKLNTGAVTSSKIADGTIKAADVDPVGGVYATKTASYVETTYGYLSYGSCGTFWVSCIDGNDLPLQGTCGAVSWTPLVIRDTKVEHWDTDAEPARWGATICDEDTNPGDDEFYASIVCISVPGP